MRTSSADRYWEQFIESLPPEAERPEDYYDAFHFGTTKEDATEIAALVLQGIKTTTGSLKWVYEAEGRAPPQPGDHSIVLDRNDNPVGVIGTTEVRVISLDEVDAQFAYDGGEGDRTLASWQAGYWSYIVSECARINREPTAKTPLICERFHVVYRAPLQGLTYGARPYSGRRMIMTESSTADLRGAILAANQKFMTAFADRDAAGMAALYTRNGQLLPPNSDFVAGAPAIQAFWQAIMDMGIKSAQLETVEAEGHGESAYEVGKYTLRGENAQVLEQGKYIVIWMREGGEWKLHRDIWNSSRSAA